MGLLDEAIREHLELKRQHGADAGDVARLEREALGPPRRGEELLQTDDGAPPPDDAPPPPDDAHGEAPVDEAEELDAPPHDDRAPAPADGEPQIHDQKTAWDDDVAPEAAADYAEHEPHPAAEPHPDVASAQHAAPVEESHADDAHVADRTAFADDESVAAPPSSETAEYDVERELEHEHAETHEGGPETLPEPPSHGDASAAQPPPPASREPGPDPSTAPDAAHDPAGADTHEHGEPAPGEDVLEETPEFLQETPEHDRLWFEQQPPRDFDFDR